MTFPGYTQPAVASPQFDNAYPDHPWAQLQTKERTFYDPWLRDTYKARSNYSQYVQYRFNMGEKGAKQMVISEMFPIHPNFDKLGLREMWAKSAYTDTRQRTITFDRYGGKMAYHKYDPLVSYFTGWGSVAGYRALCNSALSYQMVRVMDLLARNAMLQAPSKMYASGDNMADLTVADKLSTPMLDELNLQMRFRRVPYVIGGLDPARNPGTIVCLTTPGVLHDLQQQSDPRDWLSRMAYGDARRLLVNEVGTFRNVRFVEVDDNVLWNMGKIEAQVKVSSPIREGDGAPASLVDDVYAVGQPGATHWIQLAATDASGNTVDATYMNTHFAKNQMLTVHAARTSDFGVTNGVDFREGKMQNLRVAEVDATNLRISFTTPVMESFETDLGGGVYAYITKALHVHASIFVGGDDGVVIGVGEPPRMHALPPVDDFESVWRFSWDAFMGYQVFNPYVLTVAFTSGAVSMFGPAIQG